MNYISEKLVKENIFNEGIFTHGEGEYPVELRQVQVSDKIPKDLKFANFVYYLSIGDPVNAKRKDIDHYLILESLEDLKKNREQAGLYIHPKYLKRQYHMSLFKNSRKIDEGSLYLSIGKMGPHIYSDFKDMKYFKEGNVIESRLAPSEIVKSAMGYLIGGVAATYILSHAYPLVTLSSVLAHVFSTGMVTVPIVESFLRYFVDINSARILTFK